MCSKSSSKRNCLLWKNVYQEQIYGTQSASTGRSKCEYCNLHSCTRQTTISRELSQRTSATAGVVGYFGDVGTTATSATGHVAPGAVGAAVVTATTAVVTATATGTAATASRFAGGRGAREPAAGHVGERFVFRVGVPVVRVVLVHAAELVVVRRQ